MRCSRFFACREHTDHYLIVKSHNDEAIDCNLTSVADAHALAIGDWVSSRTRMIESLQDAVLSPDPMPALRRIAAVGGFAEVGLAIRTRPLRMVFKTHASAGTHEQSFQRQ